MHVYDGYHWGLMGSAVNDLLNNKLAYQESFVHYGILTTVLHTLFYKITDSIFSIFLFTSIIYSVSISILAIIIKKFTNNNYSFLFIYLMFFFQPFTIFPWHTYIIFFLLLVGIFLYFKKKPVTYFFFGFILQLIYLASDSFKFCSYLILITTIFFIFFENKRKRLFIKNSILLLSGYFLPFLIFIIILIYNGSFDAWSKQNIANIILNNSGKSLFVFIYEFFITLFKNFYYKPNYIFYIILNISCLLYIFLFIFKKINNKDILFISIITIFLNYLLLSKFLSYRIFSSVILGVITMSYLLYKSKNYDLKQIILLFIIILAPFSNPFEKGEANKNYLNRSVMENSFSNPVSSHFKYMRFDKDVWHHFDKTFEVIDLVKKECKNVKKFYNLTSDHYYYMIFSDYFTAGQIIPGYGEIRLQKSYNAFFEVIDSNFYSNLKNDINSESVIFVRGNFDENNLLIMNKKINISNYSFKNLPYTYVNHSKRVYIPKNCAQKIF